MESLYLPTEFSRQRSILRAKVDPRGELPDVSVYHDFGTDFGINAYHIVYDGGYVGEFVLDKRTQDGEQIIYFQDIRRKYAANSTKRLGFAAYVLVAESFGTNFGSDSRLSDSSLKVWEKLCGFGVARCLQGPTVSKTEPYYKHVDADFRITC